MRTERLVRIGTVTAVDRERNMVRVKFRDGDMTSGWLPVIQRAALVRALREELDGKTDRTETERLGGILTGLSETVRVLGLRVEALEAQNPHGPYIIRQPVSAEAALGETVVFTVEAAGEGLTYQWKYRNAGATTWSNSSNRTARYSFALRDTYVGRSICCEVTDANSLSVTTDVVTVSLKEEGA